MVLLFAIGGSIFFLSNVSGQNQEEKLDKKLVEIGTEFYEEFYYEQIVSGKSEAEVEEFLGRFAEIGIKVDLDNLSRFDEKKYSNLAEIFVNEKDKVACSIHNTRAIIYPQAPYTKTDHKVEAELDCGFEDSSK